MKKISIVLALCLIGKARVDAVDTLRSRASQVLQDAIASKGPAKSEALRLLGGINGVESQTILENVLHGDDVLAIASVAQGLSPTQCKLYLLDLRRATIDGSSATILPILGCMAQAGTKQAAEVLKQIANTDGDPARGVAFGLLGQMGSTAEGALFDEIENGPSPLHRETAAHLLRQLGSREAIPAFRAALHDKDARVRLAAALGLARLGLGDGKAELEGAATGKTEDERLEAIAALSCTGSARYLGALSAIVTGRDHGASVDAVWAIVRMGCPELKSLAFKLDLKKDQDFAAMMAEKLLDANDSRDAAVLKGLLVSQSEATRLIAAGRLLKTPFDTDARTVIAQGLGSKNAQAVRISVEEAKANKSLWPELSRFVTAEDPALREAAITAAGILGKSESAIILIHDFQTGPPVISLAAARSLSEIDPVRAKLIFERGLNSEVEHVRLNSAAMLLSSRTEH